jgi:hypothetical protein
MTRATVLGALLVVGGLSAAIAAQQQQPRPPLPDLMKVKDNLTTKYPGYKNERYKAAITAVYAELKK